MMDIREKLTYNVQMLRQYFGTKCFTVYQNAAWNNGYTGYKLLGVLFI